MKERKDLIEKVKCLEEHIEQFLDTIDRQEETESLKKELRYK